MIELSISRNISPFCGKCRKSLECRSEDDDPYDAESTILVYVDPCSCELKRLKTMETEISVLVAEGSNMDAGSEYYLECMENMLVGGPYERKYPEDCIRVGDDDDKGRPIVTVTHKGVDYVGVICLDGKVVSFPTMVPAGVSKIVLEYFREPEGEMDWGLLA